MTLVELSHVTRRYGAVTAVEDVSLSLNPGEVVALVGHNGAGKTTLIKLILGLIAPSSGSVSVLGADPTSGAGAASRHRLGFLPENVAFHGAMTGRELMNFYARLKGEPRGRNLELLERVGLGKAADRRVSTYSKGMRQRLGLAQALIGARELMLFDEPTSGLDPASRADVYQTIASLQAEGATILVSTHALHEIEARADRVAVMHKGRLIACGSLAEIRRAAAPEAILFLKVRPCSTAQILKRLPDHVRCVTRSEDMLALAVPPEAKLAVLRQVAEMSDLVHDIEMKSPGLEDVYRRLVERAGES